MSFSKISRPRDIYVYKKAREIPPLIREYRETDEGDILLPVFEKVRDVAYHWMKWELSSTAMSFEDIGELSKDYASSFIEKILTKSDFRVNDASKYIQKNMLEILYDKDRKKRVPVSYAEVFKETNPDLILVRREVLKECLDTIQLLLGEDLFPLFVSYIKGDIQGFKGLVNDRDLMRYTIAKHLLETRCRFLVSSKMPSYKESSLASAVILSHLMEVDESLIYIPMLIGEENFVKLMTTFQGRTMTFPTMEEIEIAYDVGRTLTFFEDPTVKHLNFRIAERMINFSGEMELVDLPSSHNHKYNRADFPMNQGVLVSYFITNFSRIGGLLGSLETKVKDLPRDGAGNLSDITKELSRIFKLQTTLLDQVSKSTEEMREHDRQD